MLMSTERGSGVHTDLAYSQIRAAIVEGRYPPGQRLIEQRLAAEFGLSRTPIREAVRRLEAEGLVVTERNRGATVRTVSATEIADSYELRARLEALVAERACERATEDWVARLTSANAGFVAAIPTSDTRPVEVVRRLSEANREFHDTLIEMAGNPRLAQILRRIVDTSLVFQSLRHFHPNEVERSGTFHGLIRDAVATGQKRRAGLLMEEHVLQGRDVLLAHLEAEGSVAALFSSLEPPVVLDPAVDDDLDEPA